eukprot:4927745-Amphidinium_carterae.1
MANAKASLSSTTLQPISGMEWICAYSLTKSMMCHALPLRTFFSAADSAAFANNEPEQRGRAQLAHSEWTLMRCEKS